MNFSALHRKAAPVIVCNVWDVSSAQAAEASGFQAIGTSSGAIASTLGYRDGEEMSFDELRYLVGRITQVTSLPLSVDLEAGYSRNPVRIAENIRDLAQLGVVGINIEDSLVAQERQIRDAGEFAEVLAKVCGTLRREKLDIFVNVRTDTFLLKQPDPVRETLNRAKCYRAAGADGLFVPGLETTEEIEAVATAIELPLNVMCTPNLPEFTILKQLGVKRISMGNAAFNKVNNLLRSELDKVATANACQSLFA